MKNGKVPLLAVLLIICIPFIYLGFIYGSLPPTVPLHFDLQGKPDGYGSKTQFLIFSGILPAVSFGVYLLLTNLEKVDPKKSAKHGKGSMGKIALAIVIFFAALNMIIMFSTLHAKLEINRLMFPLMGLFFAYLGNIMYSVKPNYFVGIRTPWTLENEDNWRKTHQLAGKLWFGGGLLIAIVTLLLNPASSSVFFFTVVTLLALVPAAYSFIIFKKGQALPQK